jgi:hypothetical protein
MNYNMAWNILRLKTLKIIKNNSLKKLKWMALLINNHKVILKAFSREQ